MSPDLAPLVDNELASDGSNNGSGTHDFESDEDIIPTNDGTSPTLSKRRGLGLLFALVALILRNWCRLAHGCSLRVVVSRLS